MTAAKPIIRAGTKLLMRKDGKLATSCCPNIYIYSRNYGDYPYNGFNEVVCLDPNELTVLWIQRPLYPGVIERTEATVAFAITESKICNNLIVCGSSNINPDVYAYTPNVVLFDLGLSQKLNIVNIVEESGDTFYPHDVFSTADGKIFVLTTWLDESGDNETSYICCYSLSGELLAKISELHYRFNKMTAQLEADGVFRIYAVGYQVDEETLESYAHCVLVCYSVVYVGTVLTITKLWEYIYINTEDEEDLNINYGGFGVNIYCPQALSSTIKQCVTVHTMWVNGEDVQTARISVIQDGSLIDQWDIPLNTADSEWSSIVSYPENSIVTLSGVAWISKQNNNLDNSPAVGDWWKIPDTWSYAETYAEGDYVNWTRDSVTKTYRSLISDNTIPLWSRTKQYFGGDLVAYVGKFWRCSWDCIDEDPEEEIYWVEKTEDEVAPGGGYTSLRWTEDFYVACSYVNLNCEYSFSDWLNLGFGTREAVECALLYRNGNHFLYFRGSSTLYPSTLIRINLTTGAAEEYLPTISWPAGEKPQLIGVLSSPATPYQFHKIAMLDRQNIKLVDVNDLTVCLASSTPAKAVESQRIGWSSQNDYFVTLRMNRELKFTNN